MHDSLRYGLPLALLLALAGPPAARADDPPKRYALVVGINEYDHPKLTRLRFAENDARELAATLRRLGYEAVVLTGSSPDKDLVADRANVEKHLRSLLRKCGKRDTVVVALSGHGLQFEGMKDCFFCPKDARPFRDETRTLVSLGLVYDEMEKSFAGMKVLLVDACRDDPLKGAATRGVDADSAPRPPAGVAALFSCRAGERAFEHESLGHGVFFHHVLEGLKGKAKDREGLITFAGLASYVSVRVARTVPELIGGGARQSPNLKADYSAEPVLARTGIIVARKGPFADYRTIAEAVKAADAGSRILVKPGVYREAVVLDKEVEIVGDGPRDEVVVENDRGNCLLMKTAKATVRGLTLRCRAGAQGLKYFAVDLAQGKLLLEDCAVTSDSLACVAIHEAGTAPTLSNCKIHDGATGGIFVFAGAGGVIEDCTITGHAMAGVEIKEGGKPTFRHCNIHDGKQSGVFVHGGARPMLIDCDIFGNGLSGVAVNDKGDPTVRGCKIRDGKESGVYVYDGGRGTFEKCDIFGNTLAGVGVKGGGDPTVRDCKIHDGKQFGVYVFEGGLGTVEGCDIFANALAGVGVTGKGRPAVRRCRIHDGKSGGVFVYEGGLGAFEDCDILANALTGVEVKDKSSPSLRKCRIHRNIYQAVWVRGQSTAVVEDCDLTDNKAGPWRVEPDCTVQKKDNRE